jgi:hypothetical protein
MNKNFLFQKQEIMSAKQVNSLTLETFKTLFDTHLSPEDQIAFTEYADRKTSYVCREIHEHKLIMAYLYTHGRKDLVEVSTGSAFTIANDMALLVEFVGFSPLQHFYIVIYDPVDEVWLTKLGCKFNIEDTEYIHENVIPAEFVEIFIAKDWVDSKTIDIPRIILTDYNRV